MNNRFQNEENIKIEEWRNNLSNLDKISKQLVSFNKICSKAKSLNLKHIRNMIEEQTEYIKGHLEEHLKFMIKYLFDKIKWPMTILDPTSFSYKEDLENIIRITFKYQSLLELAPENKLFNFHSHLITPWFFDAMSYPLVIRYKYNFRGRQKTNNIFKPEWSFTFINNLMSTHVEFIDYITNYIQSLGYWKIDARYELLKGLIIEVNEKLFTDLLTIIEMDHTSENTDKKLNLTPEVAESLLFHIFTEIIDFDKSLIEIYDYPKNMLYFPRPSDIFFDYEPIFTKWLNLELSYSRLNFKDSLNEQNAWERYFDSIPLHIDSERVPKNTYILFNYLSVQRERCEIIRDDKNNKVFSFFEGQRQLILDYIGEIKFIAKSDFIGKVSVQEIGKLCSMCNAIIYSKKVLKEWEDLEFYLRMFNWEIENKKVDIESPFEYEIKKLKNTFKLLIDDIIFDSTSEFFEQLRDYRNKISSIITNDGTVSYPMQNMIYNLKKWINAVFNSLNLYGFKKYWINLAQNIDNYICDNILTSNQTNIQLKCDIEAIINVFSEYTKYPENHFKKTLQKLNKSSK